MAAQTLNWSALWTHDGTHEVVDVIGNVSLGVWLVERHDGSRVEVLQDALLRARDTGGALVAKIAAWIVQDHEVPSMARMLGLPESWVEAYIEIHEDVLTDLVRGGVIYA